MLIATSHWAAVERKRSPEAQIASLIVSGEISDADRDSVPVLLEAASQDQAGSLKLELEIVPKKDLTSRSVSDFDYARFVKDVRPDQFSRVLVTYLGNALAEIEISAEAAASQADPEYRRKGDR